MRFFRHATGFVASKVKITQASFVAQEIYIRVMLASFLTM